MRGAVARVAPKPEDSNGFIMNIKTIHSLLYYRCHRFLTNPQQRELLSASSSKVEVEKDFCWRTDDQGTLIL
jgi:hypothetical protein